MKYQCENCNKQIVLGHDLKYELGITFKDCYHNNLYAEVEEKQFVCYCEDCYQAALERFNNLISWFNRKGE